MNSIPVNRGLSGGEKATGFTSSGNPRTYFAASGSNAMTQQVPTPKFAATRNKLSMEIVASKSLLVRSERSVHHSYSVKRRSIKKTAINNLQNAGFYTMIYIAQALGKQNIIAPIKIDVLSTHL